MADTQSNDSRTNGRWTKAQHQKFLLGLQLYGKNWKKIQELVGTRNGSQIRSHAQKFFMKTQKPLDVIDENQESKEAMQASEPTSVISKNSSNFLEPSSQHSYFMNKIIKATLQNQSFDFWTEFIDLGISKTELQSPLETKRKDSFVIFDTCNDSKQETSISCQPFIVENLI